MALKMMIYFGIDDIIEVELNGRKIGLTRWKRIHVMEAI